jgi:hypothetical protein
MVSKGELLQLAHTRLEQAAWTSPKPLSATNPGPAASGAALLTRRGPSLGSKGPIPKRPRP